MVRDRQDGDARLHPRVDDRRDEVRGRSRTTSAVMIDATRIAVPVASGWKSQIAPYGLSL